jgi:hypothetical protein
MFDDLTRPGLLIPIKPTTCSRVLADIVRQTPTGQFTVGWLLSKLHQRSFGVVMLFLGVLATSPVGSSLPGMALAVVAIQMMAGFSEPVFPRFVTERKLPTPHFVRFGLRAVPILRHFERIVHPRWPFAFHLAKDLIAIVVLLLSAALLVTPIPFSNIPPAVLTVLIALAYIQADGLLLSFSVFLGFVVAGIAFAGVWEAIVGAIS